MKLNDREVAVVLLALLVKHRVIDAAAAEDPEGYDKGETAYGVLCAARDLAAFFNDELNETVLPR